jgi:hypothetical protein
MSTPRITITVELDGAETSVSLVTPTLRSAALGSGTMEAAHAVTMLDSAYKDARRWLLARTESQVS